jgi:hypothetical protein
MTWLIYYPIASIHTCQPWLSKPVAELESISRKGIKSRCPSLVSLALGIMMGITTVGKGSDGRCDLLDFGTVSKPSAGNCRRGGVGVGY